jgi:F-box and leucine-rich repeat protein GRR1
MPDDLFVGLEACHRVERLTLTGATHLSAWALKRVISGMPKLVAVDLSKAKNVDDSVVAAIGEHCPRIQGLNLSHCKAVGDKGIMALAKSSKLLRRVSRLEGYSEVLLKIPDQAGGMPPTDRLRSRRLS